MNFIHPHVRADEPILEIGCNVGRNLNHLREASYQNLTAVEISANAIALLKRSYPALAAELTIHNGSVEEVSKRFVSGQFGLVYTMAVLEHIHPSSEWVFAEMVRISRRWVLVIEDERSRTWRHFPRNYRQIFESLGMQQVLEKSCADVEGLGEVFVARLFTHPEQANTKN